MKIFIELFPELKPYHLYKDVGQIPYYFAKQFDFNSTIVSNSNKDCSQVLDADLLKFHILKKYLFLGKDITILRFVIKNARKMDVFYQYHFGVGSFVRTAIYSLLYKLINPKGILFIRFEADLSLLPKDYFIIEGNFFQKKIAHFLYKLYFKKMDILGVCDFEDFKKLKEFKNLMKYLVLDKVKIQYNGFNIKHILKAVTHIKIFKEKENIIVASGRLSDPLKGIDILFDALNKINFKNWKLYLIGSDGEYLKKQISDYLTLNPNLKDKIINVGFLEERDRYFSILNQSKIYVFPSRIDGMPLVIPEAMALGNVIVGSSHHGMRVATEDGKIGRLHKVGDSEKLSKILSELMNNDILLEELSDLSYVKAHNEFEWSKIVQHVFKDYLNIHKN